MDTQENSSSTCRIRANVQHEKYIREKILARRVVDEDVVTVIREYNTTQFPDSSGSYPLSREITRTSRRKEEINQQQESGQTEQSRVEIQGEAQAEQDSKLKAEIQTEKGVPCWQKSLMGLGILSLVFLCLRLKKRIKNALNKIK